MTRRRQKRRYVYYRPKGCRPSRSVLRCEHCQRKKRIMAFHRGDTVCAKCRRAEARAAGIPVRPLPVGEIVPLDRADRVLRISRLQDEIVLISGYLTPRVVTPALGSSGRLHLPRSAALRLAQALERAAR